MLGYFRFFGKISKKQRSQWCQFVRDLSETAPVPTPFPKISHARLDLALHIAKIPTAVHSQSLTLPVY